MRYKSWFRYNLSKPYPFRWFTPIVIVGGIIFAVVFSTINLATQGYFLKNIYTTAPNTTLAQRYWFTKAPWAKLRPTCQAQNIPIGYQFFTTNLGLSYTLSKVSKYDSGTNRTAQLPSLQYLNNHLSQCTIDRVDLYMRKNDQALNSLGYWWSWADSTAKATATCSITTVDGPVDATFTTSFTYLQNDFGFLISDDYKHSASLWWGSRLLNLYWASLLHVMASNAMYPAEDGFAYSPFYTKGQMTFTPKATDEITDYSFFDVLYFFDATDSSLINYPVEPSFMYNNDIGYPDGFALSAPMTEGLTWAKVMYSMVLTDLGQNHTKNVLLDESLLQWCLQYPDDEVRSSLDAMSCYGYAGCDDEFQYYTSVIEPGAYPVNFSSTNVPMNQSFSAYKDLMGPLGTREAQIFQQYSCSVPVRKDWATLFVSILIADLVFLQALWKLLKLIADAIVVKQEKMAMACEMHSHGDGALLMSGEALWSGENRQDLPSKPSRPSKWKGYTAVG